MSDFSASDILPPTDVALPQRNVLRLGRSLAWAVYLGVSWTWCIGMFLPILLLRDFGINGFLAFAIPNVLGAAAMGWVLKRSADSDAIVDRHKGMCVVFSLVTIAFHAFFAAWIIRDVAGPVSGLAVAGGVWIFWILCQLGLTTTLLSAILALLISLAVLAVGFAHGDLPFVAQAVAPNRLPPIDLLPLAIVCAFGFLFCPYLDLTFHAARRDLGKNESRLAFSVGFGVVFFSMIIATLCYSLWIAQTFAQLDGNSPALILTRFDRVNDSRIALILAIHFIVQSSFTVAVHGSQILKRTRGFTLIPASLFIFGSIAAIWLGLLGNSATYHGLGLGEVVYRCFLGFYGLLFPAYVWLQIVPPRRSNQLFAAAVIFATPMMWLAFVERQYLWTIPAVAICLLAKLIPMNAETRV